MLKKIKIFCIAYFVLILGLFFNFKVNISESSPIGIYFLNYFSKSYTKDEYIIYKIKDEYKEFMNETVKELDTVKQIKAIKGDKINIKNNKLYINDKFAVDIVYDIPLFFKDEYILKENEFLTLSNVDSSLDGRYYGPIKKENIKCKAYLIHKFK